MTNRFYTTVVALASAGSVLLSQEVFDRSIKVRDEHRLTLFRECTAERSEFSMQLDECKEYREETACKRLAVTEIDDRVDGSTWVRECTPWRED